MKGKAKSNIGLFISIVLFLIVLSLVKAEAAAPKPEGTLTVAGPTFAEEGFLSDRTSQSAAPLWECVYSNLIYIEAKTMKPIPGLAERWEYSKDYRSLTFYIRKGVQFHDGWGELTAEDVKFTIELSGKPGSLNTRAPDLLRKIKSMEVVNPYTLVLHFKEPEPMIYLTFEPSENVSFPIVCKKYVESVGEEKANRQPIGSGPYRLVEQKLGDYAKFEAFDQHWMVVPEFKYIILRLVAEENTRVAMLKTGEIDIATDLSVERKPSLEKDGFRVIVTPFGEALLLSFGGVLLPEDKRYTEGYHRKDPWTDKRVREAMNIAIDRKAINKSIYLDTAIIAPIFYSLPGWDKLEPIPYDPKRAKQLLAEAGYPKGFSLKLFTHNRRPSLPLLGQAVAGYWEAIGLKPEIIQGDWPTWRKSIQAGKTAGHIWTQSSSMPFEWAGYLTAYELPNSPQPFFQSEETKAAINKVLPEIDPKKRDANYAELSKLYRSLYSHVPLVYSPQIEATNKKVGEWYHSRLGFPKYLIFARHPKPLNTWRLFSP